MPSRAQGDRAGALRQYEIAVIQLAEVGKGRMLDPQVPGLTENAAEGGVAVRTVVVGQSEAGTGERQEEDQAVGDDDLISRGAVQETVHERGRRARGDAGRLEAQPGAEERLAAVEGAVLERPIPHALDDPVGRRFDALAVPDADRSPCARNASNPAESGKACRSTGLQGVSGHRPRGRARPDGCWSLPDADALIIVSNELSWAAPGGATVRGSTLLSFPRRPSSSGECARAATSHDTVRADAS